MRTQAARFVAMGKRGSNRAQSCERRAKSELCSRVQGNTGKTGKLLNASGSETLCGELKNAARVKPSCNPELNQEVELHESIYRGRSGPNQIASQVMRSGSENFATQSKEGDAVTPSRPQFVLYPLVKNPVGFLVAPRQRNGNDEIAHLDQR